MSNPMRKLADLGWARTVCCLFNRIKLHALRMHFGFDRWHADAPCCCRPYKQVVASRLLSLHVKGVAEIGCGLGEIGRLLRAGGVSYAGLDQSSEVIKAGRFLHPSADLRVGSFDRLAALPESMDTLLLLNWPHGLKPQDLVSALIRIPTSFKYIVMDLIRADAPDLGFEYRHSVEELRQMGLDVSVIDCIEKLDHVRNLVILKNERSIHHSL